MMCLIFRYFSKSKARFEVTFDLQKVIQMHTNGVSDAHKLFRYNDLVHKPTADVIWDVKLSRNKTKYDTQFNDRAIIVFI